MSNLPNQPSASTIARNPHLFGQLPPEVTAMGVDKESDLHGDILADCRQRGWIALHGSMAQATGRTEGEPDFIILASRGRVFFIECKTRVGKLSPAQHAMAHFAEKLGHKIHLVRNMGQNLEIVK